MKGGAVVDFKTKLKLAETYAKMSDVELCRRLGTSPQAWYSRMKKAKFSDEDYERIGKALGAEIDIKIRFPDGVEF